jgi:hypothetical protein
MDVPGMSPDVEIALTLSVNTVVLMKRHIYKPL